MADNEEFEASEETENVENDSSDGDNDYSDEENIYEVDRIVGMMTHEGKTLFKVRWQGYGTEEDTWEPRDNLLSCEDLIEEYIEKNNARKRKIKQTLQIKAKKRAGTDESDERSSGTETASQESQDKDHEKEKEEKKEQEEEKEGRAVEKKGLEVEKEGRAVEKKGQEVELEKEEEEKEKKNEKKDDDDSDDDIDTLKDTFWRDLEQGLINLEGDMYSKVKGRRAALDAKKRQREKEEEEKIKQRKRKPGRKPGTGKKEDRDSPPQVKKKKKLKKKSGPALEAFETLENATSRALDMSMHSPEPTSSQHRSIGSSSSGSYSTAEEVVTVAKLERFHSSSLLSSTDDDDGADISAGSQETNQHGQEKDDSCHFLDGTTSNSRPPGIATDTVKTECSEQEKMHSEDADAKSSSVNKTHDVEFFTRQDNNTEAVAKQQNTKDKSDNESDREESLFVKFEQRVKTRVDVDTSIKIVEYQNKSRLEDSVLPLDTSSSIKLERTTSEEMEAKDAESETTRKRRPSTEDPASFRKKRENRDEQSQSEGESTEKSQTEIKEKQLKSALKKTDLSTVEDWKKPLDPRQDRNGNKENQKAKPSSVSVDSDIESSSLMEFDLDDYDPDENEEPVLDLPNDVTPEMFSQAVKDGNYILVKHALNSKLQYNMVETDTAGLTLVMISCTGQHDEVLKLLVTNGAPVNAKQKNGTTALMLAADNGYNSTVAILLEAGAHVNQQQSTGETALMKACKKGHKVIVRLLLENGADSNITSTHGSNAQQYAKMYSHTAVLDVLMAHNGRVSKAVEGTVLRYLAGCARILKPLFPTRIFPICETTDQTVTFSIKSPQILQQQGVGTLLFLIHSGFYGQNINCKLTGPCCIKDVLLNNVPQQQVVQGSNFVISLCTKPGLNLLHIKTVPTAHSTCKLLVCGYILQLTSQT
ncbi:uncharacterized protein LOC144433157 [Glandiceps talaboti]